MELVLTTVGLANGSTTAADTTLMKVLARAFRWRRILGTGRYGTIDELAAAEKINSSCVSRLLAPDIVQAMRPASLAGPPLRPPWPLPAPSASLPRSRLCVRAFPAA